MTRTNEYSPQSIPHPGETLDEKLHELGMGPKEFALRTSKPEKTINAVLKGDSRITPEMAVQFEHVVQIPAHFWLNLQRVYDESLVREDHQELLEDSVAWLGLFPYQDMVKKGWLPKKDTAKEKASALLTFFAFSEPRAWNEYYCQQQLKVAFRISLAHTKEPHAISAWLRKGELQAALLKAEPYSQKLFKACLHDLKQIMAEHPSDFYIRLQEICLSAGVKVVYTPCINKAPINGSTRWINDTPLIQLSGRYKRNDSFWFTFFHEAGHILLHGKKDIFLEDIEYSDLDKKKEDEANQFAANWVLTQDQEWEIISRSPISEAEVMEFAKKFGTHPAIIIGRLQHKGLIHYSLGRKFFEKVEIEV